MLAVRADELLDVLGNARGGPPSLSAPRPASRRSFLADVVVEDLIGRLIVVIAAPHGDSVSCGSS